MIEIKNKDMCSGCSACMNSCPQNAIEMVEDEKGFKYPKVNKEKCINCGLCEKVCPILNIDNITRKPKAYAVINKNDIVRKNSSSGGVFYVIAEYILKNNGVVFGAAFSDDFKSVLHMKIDDINCLGKLMTSKYIQSEIGNTYKECKEELDYGKKVLFTGTPCQIEGLLKFLHKSYDNLFTQDIICHGVPSPKVWRTYLESLMKKEIRSINFRDKTNGWENFNIKIDDYITSHNIDPYMKSFLSNYTIRDSCYNCKFKKINRLSDITLGDFWGIDNIDKTMNDNNGTSLVIINSNKAMELLNAITQNCIVKEVDFNESIKYNSAFYESARKPKLRDDFINKLNPTNFKKVVKKYTKKRLFIRIISKLKVIAKKILCKK
jgi:coenzyme F420-reducing hydrogenase beta subunit